MGGGGVELGGVYGISQQPSIIVKVYNIGGGGGGGGWIGGGLWHQPTALYYCESS